ncbi:ABC transporter substrate-binding protein [Parabacteroides chinchillae]|uniref:Iron complex transport system substrate-binding protein n=1 Tax=Parabacteroides chinchillae TaxID=871327 RepID=A0A8G2BYZ8_9BACT|nr:ABC transporter substrate-binding protein [Parabacteroides chinchillae]SEG26567.1 iron complex transport system substrate-binding protein [Parabacteroides chinchillae]
MKQIISLLFVLWTAVSCTQPKKQTDNTLVSVDKIQYSQGYTIERYSDYIVAELRDPWDTTRILQRYLLVDRNKDVPGGMPKGTIVRIPLKNIVVYNSVHSSIVELLDAAENIVGACESRYMDTPIIRERLDKGVIADLGEATAPNIEKMVEIGSEVILASPFRNSGYGPAEKLGIPILECADYMESTPLGRAEWLRLYGLLLGREDLADSLFRATESNYLTLSKLAEGVQHRPTVFSEKRFGSTWHIPGGASYMAHFFKDAGADYMFTDLPGAGSTPLAFETVLDKAIHADIWLIKYNQPDDMTYAGLRAEYTPYENFDAFKKKNIYACNTGSVPYYEEFPMHPDYLLKDLVWIFHPELLPDYTPRYYKKLGGS